MPTYSYACTSCGHAFDIRQSFTDDSLTVCPECTVKALRKVIHPVGIAFKGSGFYKTDSRASAGKGSSAPATDGSTPAGSTPDSGAASSTGSSGESSSAASSTPAASTSASTATGTATSTATSTAS